MPFLAALQGSYQHQLATAETLQLAISIPNAIQKKKTHCSGDHYQILFFTRQPLVTDTKMIAMTIHWELWNIFSN